jgi:uncharacterized membrane protein
VRALRVWIVVLTVIAFAAGAGFGVWITARTLKSDAPPAGPFASYEELLAQRFELSPERRHLLHSVLDAYGKDIDEIKDRRAAESMSAMEPELMERGRYYRRLIHTKVLPENRRAEFDELAFQINPIR